MKEYICPKCNKIFEKKSHLDDHMKKKISCDKNKKRQITKKLPPNPSDLPPNSSDLPPNPSDLPPNSFENVQVDDILEDKINRKCYYCHQSFTRKDNLIRHMNERCKIKGELEDEKQKIFEKLKEDNEKEKYEKPKEKNEIKEKYEKEIENLKKKLKEEKEEKKELHKSVKYIENKWKKRY
jgi:hypothetical protein